MPTFAVQKMEEVKGRDTFYKLSVNGVCLLDRFYENIKHIPKYKSSFIRILSNMESVANGIKLAGEKYHPLSPRSSPREWEFKYGDLRIYLIDYKGGKLIFDGGYKNSQDSDINSFRSLLKNFNETSD